MSLESQLGTERQDALAPVPELLADISRMEKLMTFSDDDVVLLGYEIRTHHVYNKPAFFKFRICLLITLGMGFLSYQKICLILFENSA